VCSIAVLAGIGGGAILVPCFIGLLEISMSDAVALSQATICGQGLLNVAMQLRRNHPQHSPPKATWPAVNWEYLNLLLPFAMCGTLLGSMANKVSPDWLRMALLFMLFSYILFRVILRTLEQRARDRAQQTEPCPTEMKNGPEPPVEAAVVVDHPRDPAPGKPQYPWGWILLSLCIYGISFGFSYGLQKVPCRGTGYVLLVVGSVVYSAIITLCVREYLRRLHVAATEKHLSESIIPFIWSAKTTIVFPIICIIGGSLATMLGIGGGLLFGILLLEAGLVPQQSSATAGLTTLFVASQSVADYAFQSEIRYDYGLLMFGVGLLSGGLGQVVLMRQIIKHGWNFLIVATMAFVLGGSMITTAAYGTYDTIDIHENGGSLGFAALCSGKT
jgi:uncharacterized membrane protein YfcA